MAEAQERATSSELVLLCPTSIAEDSFQMLNVSPCERRRSAVPGCPSRRLAAQLEAFENTLASAITAAMKHQGRQRRTVVKTNDRFLKTPFVTILRLLALQPFQDLSQSSTLECLQSSSYLDVVMCPHWTQKWNRWA